MSQPHAPPPTPNTPSAGIPGAVKAAGALTALAALVPIIMQLANMEGGLTKRTWIAPLLLVAVLYGMAKRHPLAWQAARLTSAVLGIVALIGVWGSISRSDPMLAVVVFGSAAIVFLAIVVLLSTTSAKRHFGQFCPRCGSGHTKAMNFGYTKSACQKCHAQW